MKDDLSSIVAIASLAVLGITLMHTLITSHNARIQAQRENDSKQDSDINVVKESTRSAWDNIHRMSTEISKLQDQVKSLELSNAGTAKEIEVIHTASLKAEDAIRDLVAIVSKLSGVIDG